MSNKTKSQKEDLDNTHVKRESPRFASSILNPLGPRGLLPWARKRIPYVRDEVQHFTDRIFNFAEDELFSGDMKPAANILETAKDIIITMDIPGFEPEKIDIQIHENTITIRAERSMECCEEQPGHSFHRIERPCGSFSRTFALPCEIKGNETASCRNGVLTISIPKSKSSTARKIKVKQ